MFSSVSECLTLLFLFTNICPTNKNYNLKPNTMAGLSKSIGTAVLMPKSNLVANQFAEAMQQNNSGVYTVDLPEVRVGEIGNSTSFSAANTNAVGSAEQTLYIFNEGVLKSSPDISSTLLASKKYNDGFDGNLINQLIKIANKGEGIKCKGFNISMLDASGNQSLEGLEACEFTIQSYTTIGGKTQPVVIDLAEAIRNNQFQQGLLTIKLDFWVNAITQISYKLPKGYSTTVNFKWDR